MIRINGASDFRPSAETHRFLLSQAMEIAYDMAVIMDLEGRITYANPAAGKTLGYGPEEIIGRFLWDVLVDLGRIGQMMEVTLDYGQWQGDVVCRRKDGAQVPVRLRSVLVQSKEGEVLGIVGMGWDLTQEQELEAQLLRGERQRLIGEMASGVAHNFNNILHGILGYTQMLVELDGLPAKARQTAQIIMGSAKRAAHLVRRIQLSVRGGRREGPEAVDVNAVASACVEATRPRWEVQAASEGRAVRVAVDPGATQPVDGQFAELDEVLTNLIFNAVDAMPEGGEIRIQTRDDGAWVVLSVSDTGIGMSRETRQRLGELFFTTKGEQGHGLGLAISYRLVEQMSGRISVESEPGKGTTFVLRFPAGRLKAESAPVPPPEPSEAPVSRRVLVIDDDDPIRSLLQQALSGCEVDTADSGEEGISLFQGGQYDLVLVDFSLGTMNGIDVGRRVRDLDPDVPLVLMTGWGRAPQAPENLFQTVLLKPFTMRELKRCMAEVLA